MDFRILSVSVLAMIALHTSQVSCQVRLIKNFDPQDCIIEGTVITLNCTVEDRNNGNGATVINGSKTIFDCSSINTAADNKLYLRHLHMQSSKAHCGDFVSGQIVEVKNRTYIAQIDITTTIAMNGEFVECSELGIQDRQQIQLANINKVEGIMADTSPTLRKSQCIEVSINEQCNGSADSFQARLQFADGACGENTLNKTIGNSTLQDDYETCIPVGTDPICFSAVVFHNGVEVARTESQELILLQCNTSNISSVYNNGVTVTTMGVVPQGMTVLHNTVLSFQCISLCALIGTSTTRCVNGTFESLLNQNSHCDCIERTVVAAVVTTEVFLLLLTIILIIWVVIRRRRVVIRRRERNREIKKEEYETFCRL